MPSPMPSPLPAIGELGADEVTRLRAALELIAGTGAAGPAGDQVSGRSAR